MKQVVLTSFFLITSLVAFCQSPIILKEGFLGDKYFIGENTISEKGIMDILKQSNAESYYQFRSGRTNSAIGVAGSLLFIGGAIVALAQPNDNPNKTVGTIGAVGAGIGLGVSILFESTAKRKKRLAIDLYNKGL